MHDTAYISCITFGEKYGGQGKIVLDVGGRNVNGSVKDFFISKGMEFICLDIQHHESVDIVVEPGKKYPFENGSIDLIISTSCFEHDPCFWMTFKEMSRIIKTDGFIYINAPSNGVYHGHPGDNWRFYSDAGQALAYWSGVQINNEDIFPVEVVETFHVLPLEDIWTDFICIWKRTSLRTQDIVCIRDKGVLEKALNDKELVTKDKF
jgi:SAM-dependent methyltransferase